MTDRAIARTQRLSKSRFVAGLQCPRLLWWKVHEPDAPELVPGAQLRAIFDRGHRVGELARSYVPGGVLIEGSHTRTTERVAATAKAMAEGAPAIYEACFLEDGVFVAVDILERRRRGYVLVEVKSTLEVHEHHVPDVAIQLHVARRAGVPIARAELMHLNRGCRYPELATLFAREDVTDRARLLLPEIPARIDSLVSMLGRPLPDVPASPSCSKPYSCPFMERCWPALPADHVSTLHRIRRKKLDELLAAEYQTLSEVPLHLATTGPARRQLRAARTGKLVVDRGLRRALARLRPPFAYLDFETIAPPVPVWDGCSPYNQIPVQLSCHRAGADGLAHHAFLADGPSDPREQLASALLASCEGVRTILAYNAPFERGCIAALAEALPHHAGELADLSDRIHDLLPLVRDHVYHPCFGGSFSLKSVIPALVPELSYDDLPIRDGGIAAAELEDLLLGGGDRDGEREARRLALLRYCERDTLSLVRLHERLVELARKGASS